MSRERGVAANQQFVEALGKAMTALVNESTWVFARCWESSDQDREATVVMLLFRHVIELIDGAHILLVELATRPAQILARSLFEGLLYLEFILENDWRRRARVYEVGSRLWSLRHSKRLVEGSQAWKQYTDELRSDPLVTEEMLESWTVDPDDIRRSEEYLKKSSLSAQYDEYIDVGIKSRWYTAVNRKLGNLRELALHLDRGGQYFLYDVWSRNIHPDLLGAQLELGEDKAWMRLLRDGQDIATLANLIAMLGGEAMLCVAHHFRSQEAAEIERRLAGEIKPLFLRLEDSSGGDG